MKNKRLLIITIVIFLVLALFFKQKPANKTFTFWTIQLKAPYGDSIQKNIDEFKKLHPDFDIVWVDIPISEAQKRTIASILGGNPPDLINLNPEFSSLLAQKNSLEYFTEEDVKPYNKSLVNSLKYEDKIYGIPFYATSAVTILNKDKFKDCNITPKTYKDILKLKSCKNPPVFGIALNEGDAFSKILNKYNISSRNLSKEKINEIYSMFYKMNKEGLLLKDTLTINHRESIEKYMAGSSSFTVAGSNFINMVKENSYGVYKNSIVLPQITGENGKYDVSLMNFIIPKNAKNKELAKEFIKLLLNKENQMELSEKTNVLPANKEALNSPYFKVCKKDLIEQARCISAKQLNNPNDKNFGVKNKKEINEAVNKSLEILFLKGEEEFIKNNTANLIETLIKN